MDQPSKNELGEGEVRGDEINAVERGRVSSPSAERPLDDVVNASSSARNVGNVVSQGYFEKTLGDPRFVALWRRRYGDAREDITHVDAGIWLGGVYQYIDDARVELVDSGKMTAKHFRHYFSVGRIAKRIHNAALADSNAPRGSQAPTTDDAINTQQDVPLPLKYMRMSREKQLTLIRFANASRDQVETSSKTGRRKLSREIRDTEKEYTELSARYASIGDEPSSSAEDEAREVWDAVCTTLQTLLERRESHDEAEGVDNVENINKAVRDFEELRANIVQNWSRFEFVGSVGRRLSGDDVEPVIPASAALARQSRTGQYDRNIAPENIQDKSQAAGRALNKVKRSLDKWQALYRNEPSQIHAGPDNNDEDFHRLAEKMEGLATELEEYFKEKPLPRRMCVAAFSSTPQPNTEVHVVGTAPESYLESARHLLHSIVGAGFRRKVEVDFETRRQYKKMRHND